ncbi:MAG: DUF2510 domain-containing protein [Actinomycetota bacterium]|nr:DUF2510 domain-containing protein [Actinomycetota bacterium]
MTVPAGWYQDPHDPARVRWWDGTKWTEHQQSLTSPPSAMTPSPAPIPSPTAP